MRDVCWRIGFALPIKLINSAGWLPQLVLLLLAIWLAAAHLYRRPNAFESTSWFEEWHNVRQSPVSEWTQRHSTLDSAIEPRNCVNNIGSLAGRAHVHAHVTSTHHTHPKKTRSQGAQTDDELHKCGWAAILAWISWLPRDNWPIKQATTKSKIQEVNQPPHMLIRQNQLSLSDYENFCRLHAHCSSPTWPPKSV